MRDPPRVAGRRRTVKVRILGRVSLAQDNRTRCAEKSHDVRIHGGGTALLPASASRPGLLSANIDDVFDRDRNTVKWVAPYSPSHLLPAEPDARRCHGRA